MLNHYFTWLNLFLIHVERSLKTEEMDGNGSTVGIGLGALISNDSPRGRTSIKPLFWGEPELSVVSEAPISGIFIFCWISALRGSKQTCGGSKNASRPPQHMETYHQTGGWPSEPSFFKTKISTFRAIPHWFPSFGASPWPRPAAKSRAVCPRRVVASSWAWCFSSAAQSVAPSLGRSCAA